MAPPVLAWPAAARIGQLRAEMISPTGTPSAAKDRTDEEQHDVQLLMPEVHAAIKDLCDTIEFDLRHEPTAPGLRRRARE